MGRTTLSRQAFCSRPVWPARKRSSDSSPARSGRRKSSDCRPTISPSSPRAQPGPTIQSPLEARSDWRSALSQVARNNAWSTTRTSSGQGCSRSRKFFSTKSPALPLRRPHRATTVNGCWTCAARTPSVSGRGVNSRQPSGSTVPVGVYRSSTVEAFCSYRSPAAPRQRKSPAWAATGLSRVWKV